MTSIKRQSRVASAPRPSQAPAAKPSASAPTPASRPWTAPAAPARHGGISAFVSKVEHAVLDRVSHFVEQKLGPYPTAAQAPARTKQLEAQVAAMGLSPAQQQTLALLEKHGVSTVDLWHGSHVVFDGDGGKLYEQLKALQGAEPRTSSHYSGVKTQQYQLTFGAAPLLFGEDQNGNTWLQMEGHAFHAQLDPDHLGPELKDDALHMANYFEYLAMGKAKNIGPLGTSPHAEHHDPLHVRWSD